MSSADAAAAAATLNNPKINTKEIDQLHLHYERLRAELKLDDTSAAAVLKARIKLLHEYNDLKDIAMMLLNLYAHKTSMTLAEVYQEFEIDRSNE